MKTKYIDYTYADNVRFSCSQSMRRDEIRQNSTYSTNAIQCNGKTHQEVNDHLRVDFPTKDDLLCFVSQKRPDPNAHPAGYSRLGLKLLTKMVVVSFLSYLLLSCGSQKKISNDALYYENTTKQEIIYHKT